MSFVATQPDALACMATDLQVMGARVTVNIGGTCVGSNAAAFG